MTRHTTQDGLATQDDAAARAAAIDPRFSYIVQAPAGSGKTTLLTQRFLALLATVETPEQVLAITFTRKAAAEMRHRILAALKAARAGEPAESPADITTRKLASLALAHAARTGIEIESFASRLRIQTIDSLNQWLARRLPIASRVGAPLLVTEQPDELYREAARRTLETLNDGDENADRVALALLHLDNDVPRLEQLLTEMLARRDHWLRLIATGDDQAGLPTELRARLEGALAELVSLQLRAVVDTLPPQLAGQLPALAAGAAARAPAEETDIRALANLKRLPGSAPEDLACWRGLAALLLTKEGQWRSAITRKQGFPPDAATDKRDFVALLQSIADCTEFEAALAQVPLLPQPRYSDAQWTVLEALVGLLNLSAAQLQVLFAERSTLDFVGVATAALAAIGSPDAPTELALAIDYSLQHILVDEFQDTSASQIRLLESLTAGWTADDGRTLFCVGDPMQSIYRFREADVALFLRVREQGLNLLRPTPLQLRRNFRSRPGIVTWVNRVFARVLPPADDFLRGAVRYAEATAARDGAEVGAVVEHLFREGDWTGEAELVVQLVQRARRDGQQPTIGILVRSRRHLLEIALRLQAAKIAFQAVDLVPLGERSAIRDLAALTRAVAHAGDRAAWLAVLRAPWCGLTLGDLERLVDGDRDLAVLDMLRDSARVATLSADAVARIQRVLPLLEQSLADRGRQTLASNIANLWYELGGPATLRESQDLGNADLFFELLDELERGGDLDDPVRLDQELERLFAAPDPQAGTQLQLMTIHRAKGLEFDVVILPGLGRRTQGEGSRLLRWLEVATAHDDTGLVLAPIKPAAASHEPIEAYLRSLEKLRIDLELGRLLYVAATRAREQLHLLMQLRFKDDNEVVTPASGTALRALWPALADPVVALAVGMTPQSDPQEARATPTAGPLLRLPSTWAAPRVTRRVQLTDRPSAVQPEPLRPEYDWVSETSRHVGTVVHEELQRLSRAGTKGELRQSEDLWWARRLQELGVPETLLGGAIQRAQRAVSAACADARGQWLLFESHAHSAAELALTGIEAGEVVNIVIDRTFVAADGTRWIVDYKTSMHEGAGLEEFLDSEVLRYRGQLARYARLLRLWTQNEAGASVGRIQLGLYFPLLGAWREWSSD